MEKSEINTVQRRSSSHIQSYYTIISVTVNEARPERDREGEEGKKSQREPRKRRKDAKSECVSYWLIRERDRTERIKKLTWTERDRGKQNGRGYYGKEVNLAVMLCLVEKKTGFLRVNYVCFRVQLFLFPSLYVCHLQLCRHSRASGALLFVCLV